MAKVFKTTIFFVDANGIHDDKESLVDTLENLADRSDLIFDVENIQESEEFEWNDNLSINFVDCTAEDYEEYFKSEEPKS